MSSSSGQIFGLVALTTALLGYLGNRERLWNRRRRRRGVRVTVIGDMSCDIVCDDVEEIPQWGEEEYVATPMTIQGGGSGLNTAAWLHYLSSSLHVTVPQTFGSDRNDVFTDCVARTVERTGLYIVAPNHDGLDTCNTSDLSERLSCEVEKDRLNWTTGASLCLGSGGRRCYINYRGGSGVYKLSDFNIDSLVPSGTQHVHIAGYYNCPGLWTEGEMEAFIKDCRKRKGVKTVSLNPQFSKTWGGGIHKLIPLVDFFICNQNEAIGISGETDLLEAVMTLANKYECNCVVVTMGGEGALIMRRCIDLRPVRIVCKDSLEHAIVDTIGVGDAFCAGFLHEVISRNLSAESPDLLEAVRFGCACGTAACTVSGGSNFPGHHTIRECLID